MKPLRQPACAAAERRGAALVLSFMVMLVLILILAQIKYSTDTAERVARNEETLLSMDLVIESALLQVFEDLKADGESDSAAGAAGQAGDPLAGTGDGGAGEASGPTDSKEDEWAKPQRTEIGQLQLRILIQDEDSKFNVLSVLTADGDEADKAQDRLARVIELSRKGTEAQIDGSTARRMAESMTEYMRRRSDQVVPRPALLCDDEEEDDIGLPLSLREFVALDPELFTEDLFRDFLDENDKVVHSLGSFLTVWSSVATLEESQADPAPGQAGGGGAEQAGEGREETGGAGLGDGQGNGSGDEDGGDSSAGQGDGGAPGGAGQGSGGANNGQGGQQSEPPPGWAINVNTAPPAVLRGLMEDRELPYRFWDDVILYRNEEDESGEENEDPPLDEYGRPIVVRQFFHSVDDLSLIDGWENMEPIVQGELKALLKTQSQVFSIFVTARKPTGEERIDPTARQTDIEREEAEWQGLVRTVRAVVWRRVLGEGEVEIVPLVRWEALDYVPFEVLDFPESRESWGRR